MCTLKGCQHKKLTFSFERFQSMPKMAVGEIHNFLNATISLFTGNLTVKKALRLYPDYMFLDLH